MQEKHEHEMIELTLGEETPTLTLEPFEGQAPLVEVQESAPITTVEQQNLTPQEQEMVNQFAQQIDITNSNMILSYGAAAQRKVGDFSHSALSNVRTKDLGEVGDMVSSLVVELKGFNTDEDKKGIRGMFKRSKNQVEALKVKYDKAENNVDKISQALEGHQIQLMKDIAILDQMYELNLVYYKELSMYILAGKQKLEETRNTTLKELTARAEQSGLPEDAQAARDMASFCDRFEKKIYDLELTRQISIQMAPQIRLVQSNDTMMAEKIQSSLVNTIPLWKSQMVLALGIANSQSAIKAQREVTDMTNELLRKNAETLRTGSIEAAQEAERGIVDIETLTYTNQQLIDTLDEVMAIQDQGRQKRRDAEQELGRIEGELKQKLLDIRDR